MTFKDSIWKEDILNMNATTNILSKDWKLWKKSLTTHVNLKGKKKVLSLANLHKLETCNNAKNSLWPIWNFTLSITQRAFFHTLQTFNELKNSFAHTFTLKLDTFKKLWRTSFSHLKNLEHLEEISSTPPSQLKMDLYSLCNLAN
jgi:hypothetical protein